MPINLFIESPLIAILWTTTVVISIAVHEFSHALGGKILGDNTAKDAGRLTLNPLAHIDITGFLMLLFVGFGWGKPTPFNPYNLKYLKWGPAIVGLFGPLANLVMVIVSAIILKTTSPYLTENNLLIIFLQFFFMVNISLMIFNLLPIPPLDGSSVLLSALPYKFQNVKFFLETKGPIILIVLVISDMLFNMHLFGSIIRFFSNYINKLLI